MPEASAVAAAAAAVVVSVVFVADRESGKGFRVVLILKKLRFPNAQGALIVKIRGSSFNHVSEMQFELFRSF